ncbi:hypothetical protein [Geodermatophilus marinus]|uniref:hypothetical protein n=1 Tax=Geodermatophilus sp. LHW52908 TaxID=2303986 RepID=UPI0011C0DDF0|nr:hypothetical protein [Geodermatophilus sp. LHW52908]
MSFREYLRWEGGLAVVIGVTLCAYGWHARHQGAADAAISGAIMLTGTGVFLALRHKVPFRAPGGWFTATPLAAAGEAHATASTRRHLMAALVAEIAVITAVTVALSVLTRFWLTYVDFGVWLVAVGVLKAGPAVARVARDEARSGATYCVARRPIRGLVELGRCSDAEIVAR